MKANRAYRLILTRGGRTPALLAEFQDMAQRDQYSTFTGNYGLIGHCSGALIAYEIAKNHSCRLLFVGNDFAGTDLESVL